jgi:hypothetical protein
LSSRNLASMCRRSSPSLSCFPVESCRGAKPSAVAAVCLIRMFLCQAEVAIGGVFT